MENLLKKYEVYGMTEERLASIRDVLLRNLENVVDVQALIAIIDLMSNGDIQK